jgi:hypothetical protein
MLRRTLLMIAAGLAGGLSFAVVAIFAADQIERFLVVRGSIYQYEFRSLVPFGVGIALLAGCQVGIAAVRVWLKTYDQK